MAKKAGKPAGGANPYGGFVKTQKRLQTVRAPKVQRSNFVKRPKQ